MLPIYPCYLRAGERKVSGEKKRGRIIGLSSGGRRKNRKKEGGRKERKKVGRRGRAGRVIRRDASRQAEGKSNSKGSLECGENEAKVIERSFPPLWADRAARGTSIRGMERLQRFRLPCLPPDSPRLPGESNSISPIRGHENERPIAGTTQFHAFHFLPAKLPANFRDNGQPTAVKPLISNLARDTYASFESFGDCEIPGRCVSRVWIQYQSFE